MQRVRLFIASMLLALTVGAVLAPKAHADSGITCSATTLGSGSATGSHGG